MRISSPGARSRSGFTLFLAALAVAGAGLVLAREVTYGPGLRGDALGLIAMARNLLAGEGLTYISGRAQTNWPPFYPLLLAAGGLVGFDPLHLAGPLNAALFGLTVFIVGRHLRRRLRSRFLAVWAALAVALSVPLATRAWTAMSEPTFILLAAAALMQTDRFLTEGRTPALAWAAVCGSLAFLTRYAGVAVPLAVGLALLCQPRASFRQRAGRIAAVALTAAVPMALWLLRNYLVTGQLIKQVADLRPPILSVPAALDGVRATLWEWSYLDFLPPAVTWALLALAAAALLPIGLAAAGGRRERPPFAWHAVLVFGGFTLLYLVVLIASITTLPHPWQSRFLAPVYVPLLAIAAFALDWLLAAPRRRNAAAARLPGAVLMVVLSLWTAGQVVRGGFEIRRLNSDQPYLSFLSQPWADSATVRHLRENPGGGTVYSNVRNAAYLYGDGTGTYHRLPVRWTELQELVAAAPDGARLIWFDAYRVDLVWGLVPYDYGVAQLRATRGLEPVAELADGAIFTVNADYAPPANAHLAAYAAIGAGALGEPAARAAFDLYLDGAELVYLKEPCSPDDAGERFFLHLFPADAADLSDRGRQHGFDNLDFDFADRGVFPAADTCLALVPLPDYDRGIDRIRTGQWIRGAGQLWSVEFRAAE